MFVCSIMLILINVHFGTFAKSGCKTNNEDNVMIIFTNDWITDVIVIHRRTKQFV